MQLVATRAVAERWSVEQAAARSTRGSTPFSTSGAGCWSARRAAAAHEERIRWWPGCSSARPLVGDRRCSSSLPVLAGAGVEPDRLRPLRAGRPAQPALRRPRQLRRTCSACRCSGRRWATRCTSWSSACRCRSRCRWPPRVLLQSPLARFKPFYRTALFAPVVTTLVAVAVIWRYLLHVRYGLVNDGLGALGLGPVRLAGRSATGRCRRSSCSRCGRTSAPT